MGWPSVRPVPVLTTSRGAVGSATFHTVRCAPLLKLAEACNCLVKLLCSRLLDLCFFPWTRQCHATEMWILEHSRT